MGENWPSRRRADLLGSVIKKAADKILSSSSELIAKGRNIRKVDELVEKFGGKAKDWKKKKGWDEKGQEWHWYENNGRKVGMKKAGEVDPF
ncbi:MAG: hypothetical protein HZT40_13575 [Candidatus Thiothrix singaporensis]|uniref:Uncharacterized protein n=1 Tax=Candidatus Thiothrix singaporensis TaxID=2799669 RepID=A0A7L6ATJ4_9GAMM|nr:MAG: hypothetical protein HZT40_13575 [Candidatus Thiothrix singaporensis]